MAPEKAKVILGDDDPGVLKSARMVIELVGGHKVLLAFERADIGLAGFKKARNQGAQLAVLDVSLVENAGETGRVLIKQCREANIPIIAYTQHTRPEWADEYFNKGKDLPNKLLEIIRGL